MSICHDLPGLAFATISMVYDSVQLEQLEKSEKHITMTRR